MKRIDIKKRPLSDTTIASLEPEATLYREKDSLNLYLQVKPTGAKSWVMRYKKADGKWGWHGLGAYPLVTGAMARKIYHDKIALLANGETLSTRAPLTTFQDVAMEWYNEPNIQKLADNTKSKILQRLQVHVFPKFGKTPIKDISRQMWFEFFKELQTKVAPKTGKPILETAKRTLEICKRIYRFAVNQEIAGVTNNPLDYMHERLEKHTSKQMAHVSEQELPKLLADIQTIKSDTTRIGLLLLCHLFLRPNEVLDGRWCEIDFEKRLWEIPAHRMKKGKTHLVPLSNQVMALLMELHALTGKSDVLFPHRAKKAANAHQRFRKALNQKGYKNKQTPHGFRHIASTKLNNHTDKGAKFDERVIEFALAHKVKGVKGVYNKAEYLEDRQVLNQWYSDFLDSLTG